MSIPNLISKPPQGQKTIEAFDVAHQALQNNPKTLILFVCGNSKAQGDQIVSRASQRFRFAPLLLHTHAFSSTRAADILNQVRQGSQFLVCLANKTRLQAILTCLETLLQDFTFRLVILVDEADKTYRLVKQHIGNKILLHQQCKLYLITATSHTLFDQFPAMRVYNNRLGLDQYMRLQSMTCHMVKASGNTVIEDVADMLTAASPLPEKSFFFIPGGRLTENHDCLAAFVSYRFYINVLVINSKGYTTYAAGSLTPQRHPKTSRTCQMEESCECVGCRRCFPTEFDVIKHFRSQCTEGHMALTGKDSISRAITIQTQELPFTHGLLSLHVIGGSSTKVCKQKIRDELYQLCSRLAGSFADKVTLPEIFTTSQDLLDVIHEGEAHAIATAEQLAGKTITREDYQQAASMAPLAPLKTPIDPDNSIYQLLKAKHSRLTPNNQHKLAVKLFRQNSVFGMLMSEGSTGFKVVCVFDDAEPECLPVRLLQDFDELQQNNKTWLWTHREDSHVVAVADLRTSCPHFILIRGERSSVHKNIEPFDMTPLIKGLELEPVC